MSGVTGSNPAPGPLKDLVTMFRAPGPDALARIDGIDPSHPLVRNYIAKNLHHEHGLAELFACVCGDLFLNVEGRGSFAYQNNVWTPDSRHRFAQRACARMTRRLSETAPSQAIGEEAASALRKLFRRTLNGSVTLNIVNKFYNEQGVEDPHIHAYELDADPSLLNTPAGVFNLKTGDRQDHRPDLLLSCITKLAPDFNAPTPLWDEFLFDIAAGDLQVIDYLQRLMGYSLTGETKEEVFHVLYGTGGNGKSTFLRVLHEIMGNYADVGTTQLVSGRFGEGARFELARLAGKRAIFVFEGVHGHTLDSARLKLITSGGEVVAESKYKDPFTFSNQVKIFLASNVQMPYGGWDGGIKRRLRVIKFTKKFGELEAGADKGANQDLIAMFRSELPGILANAIRSAQDWYETGLPKVRRVAEATREYLDISDPFGTFLEYCITEAPGSSVQASKLDRVYTQYARQYRLEPLNPRQLKQAMTERGFHQKRLSAHNAWVDIDLTDEGETFLASSTWSR